MGVQPVRIKQVWSQEDFWSEWGVKAGVPEGSPKPGKARKKGERGSRLKRGSNATGARQAGERGYLGRTDYCREIVQAVGVWAETEQQQGHEIFRPDLVRQFMLLLDSEIARMEDRQAAHGLSKEQTKYLEHWKKRASGLKKDKKKRDKAGLYLVGKTGFVERGKQRTTSLTVEEEIERMKSGWHNFDYLLYQSGCAKATELVDLVAQPVKWTSNRQEAVISMSDQIPVWLKPDSGKRLMPKAVVQEARLSKKKRVSRAKAQAVQATREEIVEAEQQPRDLVTTGGNPANSRCRYTLVARQLVKKYFKPGVDPEGEQTGNVSNQPSPKKQ